MKLSILTLPIHSNYGGILQAYALQTILERMGHSVDVFQKDSRYAFPAWKMPMIYGKRIIRKYLLRRGGHIRVEKYSRLENEIIRQHTDKFVDSHIHLRVIARFREIKESDYDGFIVGSDQIWRPKYVKYLWKAQIEDAYLDFSKRWNVKRVAYAPSFGVEEWEYTDKETVKCKRLLKDFDAVSVRESSGSALCKNHFGIIAQQMIDPTMLLSKDDYLSLISDDDSATKERTLFAYILDPTPEIQQRLKEIANEKGLKLVLGNADVNNKKIRPENRIQPPVESWIAGIAHADFIITDSFHACVFSIIFEKPFITLGNKDRGYARFHSLLSQFGLQKHLILNLDEYSTDIDYSVGKDTRDILSRLRECGIDFLTKGLS